MLPRQHAQTIQNNTPASPAKQNTRTETQPGMEQQRQPATIVQRIKADPRSLSRADVMHLQSSIGNQALGKLLRGVHKTPIQAKLTIGQPGDKYEQEADRMADQVMRMPEPVNPVNTTSPIQQQEEEEQESIQAKSLAAQITPLVQRQADEEEPVQKQAEAKEEETAPTVVTQRQPEEEESLQGKFLQRQSEEDEELRTKPLIQRQTEEEEETAVQAKPLMIQRLCPECEKERSEKEGSVQRAINSTPTITIQRLCPKCREERRGKPGRWPIQLKPSNGQTNQPSPNIESNINAMTGGGSPLPKATRSFFENRFGANFSPVRVHTNNRATETAKSINARAFTVGNNIAFSAGQYAPETYSGKRLMAHELTHVVQQSKQRIGSFMLQRMLKSPVIQAQPSIVNRQLPAALIQRASATPAPTADHIPSWFNDPAQKKDYSHQVASFYFSTGKYVPNSSILKTATRLINAYRYTTRRLGGLNGEIIGHADSRDFTKRGSITNAELSFQRARWISGLIRQRISREAKVSLPNIKFKKTANGTAFCDGDPKCFKDKDPAAMAKYRRADVLVFDKQLPIPKAVACPPTKLTIANTLAEYIELVRCAEQITGLSPRKMLSLLRQLYYGSSSWSRTQNSLWDTVIPCKENFSKAPTQLYHYYLFASLVNSQLVEGRDIGHIFTGLESMACPNKVVIRKSKLGVTLTLPTEIRNELFSTWLGDIGSALGRYVACWKMVGYVPPQILQNVCDLNQSNLVNNLNLGFYFRKLASSPDLEGDIAGFVIRAAENKIPCRGSLQQKFNITQPVSTMLRQFFFNTFGSSGKTDINRYHCFAESIGATVANNKITNKGQLNSIFNKEVSHFAQLSFANSVQTKGKRFATGPALQVIKLRVPTVLDMFWAWLENKM